MSSQKVIFISQGLAGIAKYFIILFLLVCSISSFAFNKTNPLPADQAFILSTSFIRANEVMAQWQIAPGYYLYRQKLHISFEPNNIANITYPQGEFKFDHARGRYEAYSGTINVPVSLQTNNQQVKMSIDYQGCSEGGFCYPPMHKEFLVNIVNQSIEGIAFEGELSLGKSPPAPLFQRGEQKNNMISSLLTDQNGVSAFLATQKLGMMLLIFTGLGLLLAFTPCVLPMIPILTGIIVGHKEKLSTKKAFFLSLTYVLGSAITYAFAGVAAALMGSSLQVWLQQPWIIACVSGLFVLLALSLFGFYDLSLPKRWQHHITAVSRKQKSGTYVGVFIMGMVSTLIVSPCVTAPLVGILMYIGQSGDIFLGAVALFALGIGMGIPLLIIGTSAGKVLPKSGPWMVLVKMLFGLMMLVMAGWLFSRISSPVVKMEFIGVLLIGLALCFGFYFPRQIGWPTFNRVTGVMAGLAGLIIIVGSVGNANFITSWNSNLTRASQQSFIVVHDIAGLNQQLSLAQAARKPVLLDFYADWCESCVAMDKDVFSLANVKQVLNNFVLLRADLSANSADDDVILKNYAVVAPPTVIFFNNDGKEVNSRRIVGEVNAKEFIGRLNTFMSASCDKKLQC